MQNIHSFQQLAGSQLNCNLQQKTCRNGKCQLVSALDLCGQFGVSGPCATAACLGEVEITGLAGVLVSSFYTSIFSDRVRWQIASGGCCWRQEMLTWTQPTFYDDILILT